MKTFKIISTIVLTLVFVFSLTLTLGVVGCGGDDSGSACKHKPKAGAIYTSVDNDYHRYSCFCCFCSFSDNDRTCIQTLWTYISFPYPFCDIFLLP